MLMDIKALETMWNWESPGASPLSTREGKSPLDNSQSAEGSVSKFTSLWSYLFFQQAASRENHLVVKPPNCFVF